MKRLLILLQIVAFCSVLTWGQEQSTGTAKAQKVPEVKQQVLNEDPNNIIIIGTIGKYYVAENTFKGDVNESVKSLIQQVLALNARIEFLTKIIGEKQVEIEQKK